MLQNDFAPSITETDTGYVLAWQDRPISLTLTDLEGSNGRLSAWAVLELGSPIPIPFGRVSLSNPIALSNCWPVEDEQKGEWVARCRWALETLHQHRKTAVENHVNFLEYAPSEDSTFLIDPYLVEREHTLIFGDGGNGKSILALWWALQVATNSGPVLYVDYETSADETYRRLLGLTEGNNLVIPANLEYLGAVEIFAGMLPAVKKVVDDLNPSLVIVDSAAMASGKAQSDEEMTAYYRAIRSLGTAVLTLTHVSKKGKDSEPFGSTFWKNYCRLCLRIDGEKDPDGITVGITDFKGNRAATIQPSAVQFTWSDGDYGDIITVNSADPREVDAVANRSSIKDQIWSVLDSPMTVKEIADLTGARENSVRTTLNKKTNQSSFSRGPDGKWARLATENVTPV